MPVMVLAMVMVSAVVSLTFGIRVALDIAAQRRACAAANGRADNAARAATHGIARSRADTTADRTADDGARALTAIRRQRAAGAAADRTADHRASLPADRAAYRGSSGAAKPTAECIVQIVSHCRQRCRTSERRHDEGRGHSVPHAWFSLIHEPALQHPLLNTIDATRPPMNGRVHAGWLAAQISIGRGRLRQTIW